MLISKPFGSFNARRYSKPWGATITFPDGIKPKYDFVGHWDGDNVLLKANAGSVVAFGQRDNRGNNTTRQLYIVQPDATLVAVTESEARKHVASQENA